MNIRQPIFVIGSPRSGTSLLRLLLTSHSKIIVPPECGHIVWLHDKFSNWSEKDALEPTSRERYMNDLYSCKKFDTWALNRTALDGLIAEEKPSDYAALSALVTTAYALQNSRSVNVWGDKNNFHIDHLATLNKIYPDAKFLHIVRDGRDVACSYVEVMQHDSSSPYAPKLETNIESIALEWSANVSKVAGFLSGLTSARRITVRYEDLVKQPESVLAPICNWLSLAYEPRMLDFHEVNRCNQLEPTLTMDWKQRTLEPISADTVGRYTKYMSFEDQAVFSLAARRELAEFGYTE